MIFALKNINRLFIVSLLSIFNFSYTLASTPEAQMQKMTGNISDSLAAKLAFLNTLGLNDSTAAAKKFPFVSIGVSAGLGLLENPASGINDGLDSSFSTDEVPLDISYLPLPYSPTIFARVGIPFVSNLDIAAKYGLPLNLSAKGVSFKYNTIGGEIRYSLLKQTFVIPGLSFAAGVDHSSGELTWDQENTSFGYVNSTPVTTSYKLKNEWSITSPYVSAKTGINLLIFSLVGGVSAYFPMGNVDSTFTGDINSVNYTFKESGSLPSFRAKALAGLYWIPIPFFRLGFQYDYEFETANMAIAFTTQFVF